MHWRCGILVVVLLAVFARGEIDTSQFVPGRYIVQLLGYNNSVCEIADEQDGQVVESWISGVCSNSSVVFIYNATTLLYCNASSFHCDISQLTMQNCSVYSDTICFESYYHFGWNLSQPIDSSSSTTYLSGPTSSTTSGSTPMPTPAPTPAPTSAPTPEPGLTPVDRSQFLPGHYEIDELYFGNYSSSSSCSDGMVISSFISNVCANYYDVMVFVYNATHILYCYADTWDVTCDSSEFFMENCFVYDNTCEDDLGTYYQFSWDLSRPLDSKTSTTFLSTPVSTTTSSSTTTSASIASTTDTGGPHLVVGLAAWAVGDVARLNIPAFARAYASSLSESLNTADVFVEAEVILSKREVMVQQNFELVAFVTLPPTMVLNNALVTQLEASFTSTAALQNITLEGTPTVAVISSPSDSLPGSSPPNNVALGVGLGLGLGLPIVVGAIALAFYLGKRRAQRESQKPLSALGS